jgi:uncharacterized CHY-type Zn-finger protein
MKRFKCQDEMGRHAFVEYQEKTELWKYVTCKRFIQLTVKNDCGTENCDRGKASKKYT